MQQAVAEEQRTAAAGMLAFIDALTPSEKFKFAFKSALAIVVVYLAAFSQGWTQPQTAAITIMIIATAGPVSESVAKGIYRVIGTIAGALIGMTLIGFFPQDRETYLLLLSLCVTATLYLTRAYKGDNTVFMLTAVTMMMVFQNGEVDDVFLYGIDKTFMTIFGIVVYTLIVVFIWPTRHQNQALDTAASLLGIQHTLFRERHSDKESREKLYDALQAEEKKLENAVVTDSSDVMVLNREQRNTILQELKSINTTLILLTYQDKSHFPKGYTHYVRNYARAQEETEALFSSLKSAIATQKSIEVPAVWEPDFMEEKMTQLSHLERAELTSVMVETGKLHALLRALARKFNAIISPYPTIFELSKKPAPSSFNWFDVEDMKGTLLTFMIFWGAVFFWIFFNPPAGFLIVTMATALSVITTFSPVKPSLLMIIFTLSFIFATAMYILVLPHLHYGWELGLFLFFYAFIGFYFLNPMIAIFFLLGIVIVNLTNPMYFNFQLFLITLFVFYLYLSILLFFYYIPFSTKPETLFAKMKRRFFTLAAVLMERSTALSRETNTVWDAVKARYAKMHLLATVKKMQLWASKIDDGYFSEIDIKTLTAFTKACENTGYLLLMLYRQEVRISENPPMKKLRETQHGPTLSALLNAYREGDAHTLQQDEQKIITQVEKRLQTLLKSTKEGTYTQEEFIAFYENIAMRRNVWTALMRCQTLMEELDLAVLQRSRF